MNIIVEPGVAEEVKNYLPFAFTPPSNGISFLEVMLTRRSCGTSSDG